MTQSNARETPNIASDLDLSTTLNAQPPKLDREALAHAVAAYLIWGFLPVYFNLLKHVMPLEVVVHRILWSALLLLAVLWFRKRLAALWQALTTPAMVMTMLITAFLIAGNWLVYIWAVTNSHIASASLGYFLNPMLNVVLGFFFLHERLKPLQWVAVALAALGVVVLAFGSLGTVWIPLSLALTFALYGLIRKIAAVGPLVGLTGETVILFPLALLYLLWLSANGQQSFAAINVNATTNILLIASGAMTAAPLLLFASAARRMRFATIGLLQYIGPSIQFLLALFLFHEPLTLTHFITFPLIWAGLALYSWTAWREIRS